MARGHTNLLNDYRHKDELRQQLAEEQGYLCAYCMKRINLDSHSTVIEHVKPQATYPKEQLDYRNLLLCCEGKEQGFVRHDHCDQSKKQKEIKYSPATHPCIESTIRYKRNGSIFSEDPQWNTDLDTVLNLNETRLCNNRKAVWNVIHDWLARKPRQRTRGEIHAKLKEIYSRNQEGELREYCEVMAYVLKRYPSYTYV